MSSRTSGKSTRCSEMNHNWSSGLDGGRRSQGNQRRPRRRPGHPAWRVYLAQDRSLGRRVALKVLAPELGENPGFRARFSRESQLAASIDHPNILPVYGAGEQEGEFFIAMRFVDGFDLEALLREQGPL